MALSREDFLNATPDNPPTMPEGVFGPPAERGSDWPDNPDLRAAVNWFKSFMAPEDWHARRVAAFVLLHRSAYGMRDPDKKGRFFDARDMFAWYLFQAEAFLDHMWNYEPMYGSRVVPVLTAIGRNRAFLESWMAWRNGCRGWSVPSAASRTGRCSSCSRLQRTAGRARKSPSGLRTVVSHAPGTSMSNSRADSTQSNANGWRRITGSNQRPLAEPFLVLPEGGRVRTGVHWDA